MWEGGDPNAAIDVAVLLESAGIDTIVAVDHVVMGTRTDRYVWGPFPFPAGSPWVEPLTLLTAIAARTSRIRLATGILIAGLRPAALLAKTAASMDAISRGRLELGVGVGWQPEEYSAVGVDFSRRGEVLTDTIGACRSLWGPNPCEFASDTVSFDGIYCDPKPASDRLPVLFSGTLNRRNIDRIVRLGDGWIPIMGAGPDDILAGLAVLRQAFASAGRSDADLRVRMPLPFLRGDRGVDIEASLAAAVPLAEAGVTEFGVQLRSVVSEPGAVDAWARPFKQTWDAYWADLETA